MIGTLFAFSFRVEMVEILRIRGYLIPAADSCHNSLTAQSKCLKMNWTINVERSTASFSKLFVRNNTISIQDIEVVVLQLKVFECRVAGGVFCFPGCLWSNLSVWK
jgi:hypothetical protein